MDKEEDLNCGRRARIDSHRTRFINENVVRYQCSKTRLGLCGIRREVF